jgi:hypothetical protein
MVYNVTEKEVQPKVWSNTNGTQSELLDRFAVAEICKGWPLYRDASEWVHYRNLFTDNAYIFTSTYIHIFKASTDANGHKLGAAA